MVLEDRTRTLHVSGSSHARNLVTGRRVPLGRPIEVGPLSTVVLYLED
ncbi:hypothetical protein [Nonomuraea sp. NPDC049400]